MISNVWLKVQAKKKYGRWQAGHVSAFKTKPDTREDEIALRLTLEVPDEIFEEPVYEAKLLIPKNTNKLPETTEIAKSVAAEISKQVGFRVKVDIPKDPELQHSEKR